MEVYVSLTNGKCFKEFLQKVLNYTLGKLHYKDMLGGILENNEA